MAIKKYVEERNTVTIDLPGRSKKYVENLDQSQLTTVLSAILGSKRANQDLGQVVLKGGRVKAAARSIGGEISWAKTIWSRSGPLLSGKELINPDDLRVPTRGAGKL